MKSSTRWERISRIFTYFLVAYVTVTVAVVAGNKADLGVLLIAFAVLFGSLNELKGVERQLVLLFLSAVCVFGALWFQYNK